MSLVHWASAFYGRISQSYFPIATTTAITNRSRRRREGDAIVIIQDRPAYAAVSYLHYLSLVAIRPSRTVAKLVLRNCQVPTITIGWLNVWCMNYRVLVVAFVILLAGCPSGGPDGSTGQTETTTTAVSTPTATSAVTPMTTPTDTAGPQSTEHTPNESFVVGTGPAQLRYVVTEINRTDQVGGEFGVSADEGFVVISLEVTNLGENATRLTSGVFTLVDSEGQTYATDNQAMVFLDEALVLRRPSPGVTIDGVVIFDIPADRQGLRLRIEPVNGTTAADAHYVEIS